MAQQQQSDTSPRSPPVLPPPPEPRYGIKDPLGPSDEVHRCLRLYAMQIGSPHVGELDTLTTALEPLGYTREHLEKCITDYGAIFNMYEKDGEVHFTCMPQPPPPNWDMYMGVQ